LTLRRPRMLISLAAAAWWRALQNDDRACQQHLAGLKRQGQTPAKSLTNIGF
jgi:hypothetical protein